MRHVHHRPHRACSTDTGRTAPTDTNARRRQLLRALTTLTASAAGLSVLWAHRPAAPDWSSFSSPATTTWDVEALVGSVLTVLTAAALCYLMLIAAANLALGIFLRSHNRSSRPARGAALTLTRRATPRWLAAAAVGVAASSAGIPAAGAFDSPTDPHTITLEVLPDANETSSGPAITPADRVGSRKTMLPWSSGAPAKTSPPPSTESAARTSSTPPEPPTRARDSWTVVRGEHFWSIAEQVVTERGSAEPVARYWRQLIDANRDRLTDPSNPSLIYPGQELRLP